LGPTKVIYTITKRPVKIAKKEKYPGRWKSAELGPFLKDIRKHLRRMGKRNKSGTPSRTTQINLQTTWKKPNNSPTPV
jgi:hypothetical protein